MRIFEYTGTFFPEDDIENQFTDTVKGMVIVENDTWKDKVIEEKILSQIFGELSGVVQCLEIKEIPKLHER